MNVTEILENGPQKICEAETAHSQKHIALQNAMRLLEAARASAILKNQDAKNQKVLEALVTQDENVQKADAATITALGEVKLAEIHLRTWENAFTSARKLASMNMTMNEIATPSLD